MNYGENYGKILLLSRSGSLLSSPLLNVEYYKV